MAPILCLLCAINMHLDCLTLSIVGLSSFVFLAILCQVLLGFFHLSHARLSLEY